MADQASGIFGTDKPNTEVAQGNTLPTDGQVAILVGEGRKYKSVEDLAKAYMAADGFIEKLKSENADLRTKAEKAKTIDEVLERLDAKRVSSAPDKGAEPTPNPGMSAEAVASIVRDTVTGLETAKTRQANLQKADAEMKKLYGDKAAEVFSKAAQTPEQRAALTQLAEVDPASFVKLFQGTAPASGSQVDGSGAAVNSEALSNFNASGRVQDPGTKEYWDEVRKKSPSKYYDAASQLAMQKAATENPTKYFGRKIG